MRTSSDDGWDGPRNLLDAARVAASAVERGSGDHGGVRRPDLCRRDCGQDPRDRRRGVLRAARGAGRAGRSVEPPCTTLRRAPGRTPLRPDGLDRPRGAGLPVVVGDDGTLLDLARPEHDGVVVEAFGSGNMPPGAVPAVRRWLDEGKPVVLASRCPYGRGHAGLRLRGRRRAHRRHGRDSGGPAHAVPGAHGADAGAVGRRRVRRAMSAPGPPGDPGGGARDRADARGGGLRGLVRRRRAPRRPARPPPCGLRLRHVGHAGPGDRAVPAHGAGRREVRHGGRAGPPPRAPRGDHLPPRRRHRRPPRGRGLRRLARGRSRPAGLHRSTPSRTIPLRHEWRDPFGGRADLERGLLRAVGEPARAVPRGLSAHSPRACASRRGSASPSSRPPGPRRWRRRPGWRSSPPSGCGTNGSRDFARRARRAGAGGALVRVGAAERWMPELASVPARASGAQPVRSRSSDRDPVLLTAAAPRRCARRCSAASARRTPRSSARRRWRAGPAAPAGQRRPRRAPLARRGGPRGGRSAPLHALLEGGEAPWATEVRRRCVRAATRSPAGIWR